MPPYTGTTQPNLTNSSSTTQSTSPAFTGFGSPAPVAPATPTALPTTPTPLKPASPVSVITAQPAVEDFNKKQSGFNGVVAGMQQQQMNTQTTARQNADAAVAAMPDLSKLKAGESVTLTTGTYKKNADGTFALVQPANTQQPTGAPANPTKEQLMETYMAKQDPNFKPTLPQPTQPQKGALQTALDPIMQKREEMFTQYQSDIQRLQNGTFPLTPDQQAQIDYVKQSFERLKEQQAVANKNYEGGVTQSGIAAGRNRYAPEMELGNIAGAVNAGIQKIAEIEQKAVATISELKTAFEDKNYKRVNDLYNTMNGFLREKEETIKSIHSDVIGAEKEAYQRKKDADTMQAKSIEESKKQKRTASVDSAISDLLAQGVNDPSQILSYLNYSDSGEFVGDVSMSEVSGYLKSLQDLEKQQPGIVGEWIAAKENDPAFAEVSLQQYMDMKNPTNALDQKYKELQIQKMQQELDSSGVGGLDASQAIAYAQQYAATGNIPTGLPKGSFGVIASAAKELPREKGAIVNRITGVKDGSVGVAEQDDFKRLYNIINSVERLEELDRQRWGGVIGGTLGKVFGDNESNEYMAIRKQIVDDMQRMQSGAALTETEQAFYEDYIPGRFSDTGGGDSNLFGEDSGTKIRFFKEFANKRLQERLSNNDLAIYGYSKVKVGDQEYAVGDVITNANGQAGRILPDGSIAIEKSFNPVGGDTNPATGGLGGNVSPQKIAAAIKKTESGGNYDAKGESGEGGAYQFMPATWKQWATEHLGSAGAPQTPANQDKVAVAQISKWQRQGYNPQQIALMWNGGEPKAKKGINKYGVKYDSGAYAQKVLKNIG